MTEENQTVAVAKKSPPSMLVMLALLITVINFLLLAWFWFSATQHFMQIEESLSVKLHDYHSVNEQSLALAKQADERSAKTQAQTMIIQEKLAESRDQQEVLQTLYDQLAEDREETVLAEVEQLVSIANQQLQLTGNIKAALLALQAASRYLEPINLPRANQLREVLSSDIQHLREYNQLDLLTISAQLETLTTLCADLPLSNERALLVKEQVEIEPTIQANNLNQVQKVASKVWEDVKSLVKIEYITIPEPPLLSADHRFYLNENLKLRLLTARIALLQHDEASYHADLAAVSSWLTQYFDVENENTIKALALIETLQESKVALERPELSESIAAIGRYKVILEKP